MPHNLTKRYSGLLEILHLNVYNRTKSLRLIFDRDIQDNENLSFLTKVIRPTRIDGQASFETVFNHLIKKEIVEIDEFGKKLKKREFEFHRAQRLHWIKYHIEQKKKTNVEVFSTIERDKKKRKDVNRTYIYDIDQEYVIVLEPQNSGLDYYLLSAYYLNESWAPGNMKKKLNNKLPNVL